MQKLSVITSRFLYYTEPRCVSFLSLCSMLEEKYLTPSAPPSFFQTFLSYQAIGNSFSWQPSVQQFLLYCAVPPHFSILSLYYGSSSLGPPPSDQPFNCIAVSRHVSITTPFSVLGLLRPPLDSLLNWTYSNVPVHFSGSISLLCVGEKQQYLAPSAPVWPAFSLPARSTRFSWDMITCTSNNPDNNNFWIRNSTLFKAKIGRDSQSTINDIYLMC